MKQKRAGSKPYGLRARLGLSLVVSLVVCIALFFLLYSILIHVSNAYIEQPGFEEGRTARQFESLQEYINSNSISSHDLEKLKKWEDRRPVLLLELSAGEESIYSSFYDIPGYSIQYDENLDNSANETVLDLTDMKVKAVLYLDLTYQYYVMSVVLSAIISVALFILLFLKSTNNLIGYVRKLNEEVQILEGGSLEYEMSVEGNDEITDLAESMNRMKESFRIQMDSEQQLRRANRQMVSEMSHDIRTPLTALLLYIEILRGRKDLSENEIDEYLNKIEAKATHMKQLSDHLLDYTIDETALKQAGLRSMEDAFGETINDFTEDLRLQGFKVVSDLVWDGSRVLVNDEYVKRIFENIASNIIKYADPGENIILDVIGDENYCGFSVMNSCRSDYSSEDSKGIGLESIHTMTEHMNGICTVDQTGTAYIITVLFPKQ